MLMLNVGCGTDYREGYINIDGSPAICPDKIIDMNNDSLLDYFEKGTIDFILANDIIEHFFHWQAVALLNDFYLLLRSGGGGEIRVPDCDFILNTWHVSIEEKITYLYGGQDIPQGYNSRMDASRRVQPHFFCHKFGWTKSSMSKELQNTGFNVYDIRSENVDFIISFRKP